MIETPHKEREWAAATAREYNVSAIYMERRRGLALKLHRADVAEPLTVRIRTSWLWRRWALANLVETNWRIVGVDLRW